MLCLSPTDAAARLRHTTYDTTDCKLVIVQDGCSSSDAAYLSEAFLHGVELFLARAFLQTVFGGRLHDGASCIVRNLNGNSVRNSFFAHSHDESLSGACAHL